MEHTSFLWAQRGDAVHVTQSSHPSHKKMMHRPRRAGSPIFAGVTISVSKFDAIHRAAFRTAGNASAILHHETLHYRPIWSFSVALLQPPAFWHIFACSLLQRVCGSHGWNILRTPKSSNGAAYSNKLDQQNFA